MTKKLMVLFCTFVLFLAVSSIADRNPAGEDKLTLRSPGIGEQGEWTAKAGSRAIVWDNGLAYVGIAASQYDVNVDPVLDPIVADDFEFTVDQPVNDVHWIGGYWNGPPDDGDFDWEIIFYDDIGDGTKPGATIGTYTFPNIGVNETWIDGTPGGSNFYSYSVNLPGTLTFLAGIKYWISIQGIGTFPPQSGVAYHEDPILLHQAVFKSDYFSFPDWTNSAVVFGAAIDLCFQLTYEETCNWQPGDSHKMHYPQLPDEAGWDVNATAPVVLADDWMCSETGWVKDIHWWGSWLDGVEGEIINFVLSIHEDIPADQSPTGYSMPGATLWEMEIPGFPGTPKDPPTAEGWYDPSTGFYEHPNHQAYFQYDYCLDESQWFWQDSGTIYWLNISAVVSGGTLYTPGDVNGDGVVGQPDVDYLSAYLFSGGPPPPYDVGGFYPAADANGDCSIGTADLTYLINYVSSGGPPPTYCPTYPPVASAQWGWKSTQDHWNDDAVWAFWGNLNWIEMYEPGAGSAGPINNDYLMIVGLAGEVLQASGSDYFGDGWYYYPNFGWWNIWFYDHPFRFDKYKTIHLEFDVWPFESTAPASFELAINWATDAWYEFQPDSTPPLPTMVDPTNEDLYIGRETVFQSEQFGGHYIIDLTLPWYNPEWISIDVRGFNYNLDGWVVHDCVGDSVSLDLAFVITGEPPPLDSGACCLDDGTCVDVTAAECGDLNGTYLGDGTACEGDINPQNGIDDACETGPFGACCFADGSCNNLSAADCANQGGVWDPTQPCQGDINPQNGIDDACETGPFGACCFTDGSCNVLSATDCANQGGTYLGDNTSCQGDSDGNGVDDACEQPGEGACCYGDGSCSVVPQADCEAAGGTYKGDGTACLGDHNNNGTDDACETWNEGDPHKMHYPQLPDTLGWDVNASWPLVLADDWQCSESGWVKDIHWWGSWLYGETGNILSFTLSIHSDIPAGTGGLPYSRPGDLLWEHNFTQFNAARKVHQSYEGYYDPYGQIVLPDNHQEYWQYDVYLDSALWFWQEEGTIYWLNITAEVEQPTSPGRWGWKSSINHFNDDAVWGFDEGPGPCIEPNNGTGVPSLPGSCTYTFPNGPISATAGLPEGSTLEFLLSFDSFFDISYEEGGNLGGEIIRFKATAHIAVEGTGALAGFVRNMSAVANFEIHRAAHPPEPGHVIETELVSMDLAVATDPDFDWLGIAAGSAYDLPSPGITKISERDDGNFNVDSFFDIFYEISFVGAPGSALEGMSGPTTGGPARLQQGGPKIDVWAELYEPPDFEISMDLAFVITGDPGFVCDCTPGEANNDGTINILDITYLIAYLYKGGPPPTPYRVCSGDPNCDCTVNILDVTYLIAFLYKGGNPPCDCPTWVSNCGSPIYK